MLKVETSPSANSHVCALREQEEAFLGALDSRCHVNNCILCLRTDRRQAFFRCCHGHCRYERVMLIGRSVNSCTICLRTQEHL